MRSALWPDPAGPYDATRLPDVSRVGAVVPTYDNLPAKEFGTGTFDLAPLVADAQHRGIRGNGVDRTTLYFPTSLLDLRGTGAWGGRFGYGWGAGFLEHFLFLQDLTILCAPHPYTIHGSDLPFRGYNAIFADGVNQLVYRNLRIVNADIGLNISHLSDGVIENIELRGEGVTGGTLKWHYGLRIHNSHRNLVRHVTIVGMGYHDVSFASGSSFNVLSKGKGKDVNIDHHYDTVAPHDNVVTDWDVGNGNRVTHSGGSYEAQDARGKRLILWNCRKADGTPFTKLDNPLAKPGDPFGGKWPGLVVVGYSSTQVTADRYLEKVAQLEPRDLYDAQRGQSAPPPPPPPEPPMASVALTLYGNPIISAFGMDALVSGVSPIQAVQFWVDGTLYRTETSAPYTLFPSGSLNGFGVGTHTVEARVLKAGVVVATTSLTITEGPPAPPPVPTWTVRYDKLIHFLCDIQAPTEAEAQAQLQALVDKLVLSS